MDDFNTIRLMKKTIDKFKKYSRKISPSYSETLDFMIAFFEDNNLSPYDTLRMSNTSLLNTFNKRMDAVVSIFRNVEETQLKPTREMIESLFEGIKEKQPLLVEKNNSNMPVLITESKELTYYRNEYLKKQSELTALKHKIKKAFDKFKHTKHTFGSDQYVLKLNIEDYKALKVDLFNKQN